MYIILYYTLFLLFNLYYFIFNILHSSNPPRLLKGRGGSTFSKLVEIGGPNIFARKGGILY